MESSLLRTIVLLCSAAVLISAGFDDDRTYTAEEGASLYIRCNVTVEPDLFVYWVKNDSAGSFVENGTTLGFANISRADAGGYLCHVENETIPGDDRTVDAIYIDVQYPATVRHVSVTPATTLENETFTVTCVIDGNPAPEYWIASDWNHVVLAHGVSAGTVTATRSPTECMDSTAWYCAANNKLNTDNSTMHANATVYCAPRPSPSMQGQYVSLTYIGTEAMCFMNYIGNPAPNMTWEHAGRQHESFFYTDSAPSGTVVMKELSVRLEDFLNNYTLTMDNHLGSYVAEYRLISYGKPYTPTNLHAKDIRNNSATMVWTSGFDMGWEQHFMLMEQSPDGSYIQMRDNIYVNYTDQGVNQTCTYHLERLDSGTNYRLAVVAQNRIDPSLMSEPTDFTTLGNPPPHSSSSKTGLIVGSSVGGVCFLALVVLGLYCMVRRSKRRIVYDEFK